jgi:hypothetical protein
MRTYIIEDEFHCNICGRYASFKEALAELKRWAELPWGEGGHVAPCQSWKTCHADYIVGVEYDALLQEGHPDPVYVLTLSARGAEWQPPFDRNLNEILESEDDTSAEKKETEQGGDGDAEEVV